MIWCRMIDFTPGMPYLLIDGDELVIHNLDIQPKVVLISVLVNEIKSFIQAVAGQYVSYSSAGAVYEASPSLQSAIGAISGEHDVKIMFKLETVRHYPKATIKVKQSSITENWSMSAATPVTLEITKNEIEI